MILFSDKIRLESIYDVWRRKHGVMDCCSTVITFLQIAGIVGNATTIDYKTVYKNLEMEEGE
jgi:uncharacterized membrane protein